jgi:AcrR family transcriptional regulator
MFLATRGTVGLVGSEKSERDRLLSLVADYCLERGVATLTLRGVSDAVGTNNRMLLYYFSSKEELIAEALTEAKSLFPAIEDAFETLEDRGRPLADRLQLAWRSIAAPENVAYLRLFFEVFGLAVREPERYAHFIDGGQSWPRGIAKVLRAEGVPTVEARSMARELVALWRGLQFDLLANGNHRAVEQTHDVAAQRFAVRVDRCVGAAPRH